MAAVPIYHSLPGAPATLYLDFDGHYEAWNNVNTVAYDADGDVNTFNAAELSFIENVWRIASEDYSAFNIDVTTQEPPVLAPGMPASAANGVALRVAIGAAGISGGGYGYYDSFTNSTPNTAWVNAQGQTDPMWAGTAVSHEAGHSFGLRHHAPDNFSGTAIMSGFNVEPENATWRNGLNELGNPQDEIAMIARPANSFAYRPDDHSNTLGGATPLSGSGTSFSGAGVVGASGDIDFFSLTTTEADDLRIAVEGSVPGQNLDAIVELYDQQGALLVSINPGDTADAYLFTNFAGTRYIAVKSNGEYGRIGQYAITVSESSPAVRVGLSPAPYTTTESGRSEWVTIGLESKPASDVVFNVSSSDPGEGAIPTSSLVFTPQNWFVPQTVTINGVNDGVLDGDVGYTVSISAPVSDDPVYHGLLDPPDLSLVNLDDDTGGQLYWIAGLSDAVQRGPRTGDNSETLIDLDTVYGEATYGIRNVAFDPGGGKVYWTAQSAKTITRANLDGTAPQIVVSGVGASGIAIDAANGKMYWTNTADDKIQRSNLDGSGLEDLVVSGLSFATIIELDVAAGKMYWIDSFTINRANLDGSGIEVIVPSDGVTRYDSLELDAAAGKMYFGGRDTFPPSARLYRANLDGTGREVVVDTTVLAANAGINEIAIDHAADRLYWTDNTLNGIYSAGLDGSNVAAIREDEDGYWGIAVLQPMPGITVTPTAALVTTESGGTATFTVALNAPPTSDVVIPLSTSDTTEGTVSPASLTFTAANWNVPQTVTVTGVDDPTYDGNVAYTVVIQAATSADARCQGINAADVTVTNNDNDPPPTKFYVVNDASTNLTYEYSATGTAIENYSLNSGNTSPRGAASNLAGDKTWVVDANKKVYVYNTAGALLGSWTANGLSNPQGVTVWGNDLWIVDSSTDRVYKYTSGANRLSGSQSAASNFKLNSSNSSATDLVTNGTHIWVVNDTLFTDKVFKYTVSGSLVGSWTISSGGGSPTGITIDPSNVSDIWTVDSATDRVYQFTAAASRTSGSQTPVASFALAAGNTNPQGIADPPAAGLSPVSREPVIRAGNHHARIRAAIDFLLSQPEATDLTKPRRSRPAWV
jgi:hypothetical protein